MQAGHMRPIAGTANTGKRGLSGLRFGRILLGLALLFLSYSELGFASEFCRPGDSLWEVSSRGLPDCPHVSDGQQLELFQFQQGCWSAQPLGLLREFVSAAIGQRVVIYVHGNRMSQQELHIRAQQVYRRLVSNVRCDAICFIAFLIQYSLTCFCFSSYFIFTLPHCFTRNFPPAKAIANRSSFR